MSSSKTKRKKKYSSTKRRKSFDDKFELFNEGFPELVQEKPNYIKEFVQNPNNMDFNDMMQMIVDNKVEVNVKDPTHKNYTALMYNVEKSDLYFVTNLLDIGADPNIQDINKETALFKVLKIKYPTIVPSFISVLLKNGADKTITNKKGLTAYDVALSQYNPNDLPALLLNPNGGIKPKFVDEILEQSNSEKDLYKYLSSSSNSDKSSPKLRYQELLKSNQIRTVNSIPNDLFKIQIKNPKEIFENYRNLSHSDNIIDCAYQSLFALGLIGRSAAKKGSKSAILVKKHYSDKKIGVSLDSIKNHIISMFDLKPDDIVSSSVVPEKNILINFNVYLQTYLRNNTCTIVFIEFANNNIGHFCIIFKQDDKLYIFDPQFTGRTKISHLYSPIFPFLQLNNFYSKMNEEPVELTEYSVFLFQNSVPSKPIRTDYCSYNLPLFVK